MYHAASFVQTVQVRQGFKMACIEEIAFSLGYITRDHLKALGQEMAKNEYGQYLMRMAEES
jgi:glucose-1-phosphate thymidylyltransferase